MLWIALQVPCPVAQEYLLPLRAVLCRLAEVARDCLILLFGFGKEFWSQKEVCRSLSLLVHS